MMGPRTNFGTAIVQPGSVPAYANGGAIDDDNAAFASLLVSPTIGSTDNVPTGDLRTQRSANPSPTGDLRTQGAANPSPTGDLSTQRSANPVPRAGGGRPVGTVKPANGGYWGMAQQDFSADPSATPSTPMAGGSAARSGSGPAVGSVVPANGGYWGMAYAQGGAVDTDLDANPMMRGMGTQLQVDINSALGIVKDIMGFGRQLHGLGGGERGAIDTAGLEEKNLPSSPGQYTPTERPMPKPNAFPYAPGQIPFGKRSEGEGDQSMDVAGLEEKNLPSSPGQYTPTERPMPRPNAYPYAPGQIPFGKRVSENAPQSSDEEASETPEQEMAEGAIDTDEENA